MHRGDVFMCGIAASVPASQPAATVRAVSSPRRLRSAARVNRTWSRGRTDGRRGGKAIDLQSAAVAKVVSKIAALCYAMRCEALGWMACACMRMYGKPGGLQQCKSASS